MANVKSPKRFEIRVEATDPFRGSIRAGVGPGSAFNGWLELLSALVEFLCIEDTIVARTIKTDPN